MKERPYFTLHMTEPITYWRKKLVIVSILQSWAILLMATKLVFV